jgi:hypothetical protein
MVPTEKWHSSRQAWNIEKDIYVTYQVKKQRSKHTATQETWRHTSILDIESLNMDPHLMGHIGHREHGEIPLAGSIVLIWM